jgi:hypothetical protein
MPVALFGIEDGSLNLAVNLLLLVLVVVWLSLVDRTFADARRRVADPVLVGTATDASLIPFIGTIVYTILRPPEFLADAREREIETQASELRMRHLTAQSPRRKPAASRSATPASDAAARKKRDERPQRAERTPSTPPPADEGEAGPRRRSTTPS